jgi:hypothetical protein
MKKLLCVLVLACAANVVLAEAEVDLWLTPEADAIPYMSDDLRWNCAPSNYIPGFGPRQGGVNPPMVEDLSYPLEVGDCCGAGDTTTLYLWGRFNDGFFVNGSSIFGMQLGATTTGCMEVVQSTYYLQKKTTVFRRWDNEAGEGCDWGMGCGGTYGILANVSYDGIVPNTSLDLQVDSDGDDVLDTFLLGAIEVRCNSTTCDEGELYVGLGPQGLGAWRADPNFFYGPPVAINGTELAENPPSGDECLMVLSAFCTPEPASLLLIGLAGLFLRRR